MLALLFAGTAGAQAPDCRAQVRPLLLNDQPAEADVAAARAICEAAYARGEAEAGYQLALLDLGPDGWYPDRAADRIRAAATAGVAEAQYWMAWQLESGPLLPNDPKSARGWYELAADQSHRLSLLRLAEAYETGAMGLPVDSKQALEFRALAAQCENEDAP